MVTAVGIHVIDEAVTGFLPFYNEQVLALRVRLGFFPAPTFTFPVWIGGLTFAVILGLFLIRAVQRGGTMIRVACSVLAVLMTANALGHLGGSVYFGRRLPGFWSSPWLLVTSFWMLVQVIRGRWTRMPDGFSEAT